MATKSRRREPEDCSWLRALVASPLTLDLSLRDAKFRQLRGDILPRASTSSPPCRCRGSCRRARCRTSSGTPSRCGQARRTRWRPLGRIGEDRIVRFDVLGELLVRLRVVDADREVGDVELPNGLAALTERLAFGRSPAGEGFGEPGEHDGALALVVGELMRLAVRARQVECGREVAHFQFRAGLLPQPVIPAADSNADTGRRLRVQCVVSSLRMVAEVPPSVSGPSCWTVRARCLTAQFAP